MCILVDVPAAAPCGLKSSRCHRTCSSAMLAVSRSSSATASVGAASALTKMPCSSSDCSHAAASRHSATCHMRVHSSSRVTTSYLTDQWCVISLRSTSTALPILPPPHHAAICALGFTACNVSVAAGML